MEVMRILNALKVQPRRTIRIGLWTGEEQGEFGSYGYVRQHFGYVPLSEAPDQVKLPDFLRKPAGPVVIKPEQAKISGYFNVDNGTGKIRGIYLQQNSAIGPIFQQWIAPLGDLGVTPLPCAIPAERITRRLIRSVSQDFSSFRTCLIMDRARTIRTRMYTSVSNQTILRRPPRSRQFSSTTRRCATRCCRGSRYRIRS